MHTDELFNSKNILDQKLSVLTFMPYNNDNPYLRTMLTSEVAKEFEAIHETDAKKHTVKTKYLFIHGDQLTSNDVFSTYATVLVLIAVTRNQPEQA